MATDPDMPSPCRSDSSTSDTTESPTTPSSSPDDCTFHVLKHEHQRTSPFAKYTKPDHDGIYQLQEAIATTLSNASPDILTSFIDPTVSSFKAVFKSTKHLVIWRKANAVFIGIFENHTSMKAFGFEHLVGVAIGYDGSWRIIKGAGNAFCDSKWAEVWTGKYRCFGGVDRMVVEGEEMEMEKGKRAGMLAAEMLEGRFWEAKVDVKTM